MFQEIITYMIIGAAVAFAISKMTKKLKGKKRQPKKVDFEKETFSMQHNCSDCPAECMLRDAAKPIIENNKDLCKKIEIE